MRVQLCLSLALYLMQNIEGVHASVPDLTSLITTSCNGPSDSDDLGSVEVTITQQNLSRLNLTSVEELRLLDSNPDCKPLPCCGGSSWNWQFSEESLCGGQLKVQVQDNYEIVTLGNVLYVDGNGSNMGDAKSWMALIACSFLMNISGSGMNAPPLPVAMPAMNWSLFRTKSFQYFPEESQHITLNPSTYVGNWKGGGWLQLDINPSNHYELDDLIIYTGVHFTVNSYNLNFVHEQNGSNTTEVKPLIKNGLHSTKSSNGSDAELQMALITCHYPRKNVKQLIMPAMEWSFYRTSGYEESPSPSQRINHYPSTYVGNWKGGGWLQLVVKPKNRSDLTVRYGDEGAVRFTVSSYLLNFISDRNGSNITRVKPMIRKGCPLKSTNAFFEYHGEEDIVHHYKKVAFVINLLDLAGSDDKYAYVLFNISLCKDFGADYPHLPACQGYASWSKNCYQEMEEPNPSFTISLTSGLLTLQNPKLTTGSPLSDPITGTRSGQPTVVKTESESSSPSGQPTVVKTESESASPSGQPTVVKTESETSSPSGQPTVVKTESESSSPSGQTVATTESLSTTISKEKGKSDEPVLKPYLVAVVCAACFICGCTLVGVIWIMHAHKCNVAISLLSTKSVAAEEEHVDLCDVSSLVSGMASSLPLSPAVKQASDHDPTAEAH